MKTPPSDSLNPIFAHTYPMPGGHQSAVGAFEFACPECRSSLQKIDPNLLSCPQDGGHYPRIDGIWRLLAPGRLSFFQQFIREYEIVRKSEGRGSPNPEYYRALPFEDLSGKLSTDWIIRARSYQTLIGRFLEPLEKFWNRPLKILDIGAGNCWLSNRLAQRGHVLASVDLLTNSSDGLGSHIFYNTQFTPVQSEFDRLPFQDAQADLLVFNASLHYSTHFETTLGKAQRVLRPGGQLVILDTPIYHNPDSGRQMVSERERQFSERYGFLSNALPSENFLTHERLERLAKSLGILWQIIIPDYSLGWKLRRLKARLRARREPAEFLLLIGHSSSS